MGAAVNGLVVRNSQKGLVTADRTRRPRPVAGRRARGALAVRAPASTARSSPRSLYEWTTGDFAIDVAFRLDPLSAVMLFVVTFVGFLIHVYSVGYMGHDPGYRRFFAYLNLFMGGDAAAGARRQLPA